MKRFPVVTAILFMAGCYTCETMGPPIQTLAQAPQRAIRNYSAPVSPDGERAVRGKLTHKGKEPGRKEAIEKKISALERRMDVLLELARKVYRADSLPSNDLRSRCKELQEQNEQLKEDLGKLQRRHVELAKKMAELKWAMYGMGGEKLDPPPEPGAKPRIEGTVVGVSNRVNLVVISVGADEGVRVGFEFLVTRGCSYIGRIAVEKAMTRQSACRVLLDRTKERITAGDKVSTWPGVFRTPLDSPPVEVREVTEEPPIPDGRVTRADVEQGYAYIDLGAKDGVRPGQRFRVYSVLEEGRRVKKGELRIIRVEKDFSQCSILVIADAANPIVMGDYIWNKFFTPGVKIIFAFVGKFGGENARYGKERLMKVIEDADHIASDKVRADTRYAVLGEDYLNDPQYKLVQDYRIEKIKPRDIFKYLGFGRFD